MVQNLHDPYSALFQASKMDKLSKPPVCSAGDPCPNGKGWAMIQTRFWLLPAHYEWQRPRLRLRSQYGHLNSHSFHEIFPNRFVPSNPKIPSQNPPVQGSSSLRIFALVQAWEPTEPPLGRSPPNRAPHAAVAHAQLLAHVLQAILDALLFTVLHDGVIQSSWDVKRGSVPQFAGLASS